MSRWINPETGAFWNGDGPWDNRTLSDEAKQAEPWYDPRWKPFSDCMVARGYDVRASSSRPFAQEDLDRVIDQANVERAGMDHRTLKPGEDPGGIAGAFLACANRWLTIAPDDYAANGIRWLEPGDLPAP
ncbi:MAG: hypothetical protein IT303_05045 [Dehalococcoidia bacterium]|nr:hypothetical protein [Dehalococcoidia bacterium]